MSKKLHDRLARLERCMPGPPKKTKHREEFERRVRISRLYMAWQEGEIEEPELADPRDRKQWERMEATMRVARKVAARLSREPR